MQGMHNKTLRKSVITLGIIFIIFLVNISPTAIALEKTGTIQTNTIDMQYRNVTVYAPAVGESQNGYIGVISTITVTIQNQGSGRVFVDTLPLAQIDMQGSARLAVKVASSYIQNDINCSVNPSNYDYFFVIRTASPIIGGPSAGAVMTAAVISLLQGWDMDEKTVMTGMINPDGSIGPIGGIPKKIDAAHSVGATRFLIPKGQGTYIEETIETVNTAWGKQIVTKQHTRNVSDYAEENYGIEVIEVEDINDVMLYYTGYYKKTPEIINNSVTEEYRTSMQPLATSLLQQANTSLNNATVSYEATDIPSNFFYNYRGQILDALDNAEDSYDEAWEWYDQQKFYTSTSKSFQSLINSRFARYACDYFNTSDKDSYMHTLLNNSVSYVDDQTHQAKMAAVQGAISLQCIGAAQKRATEASSYLSIAREYIDNDEYFNALYQLAFSVQRAESISWWLGLIDQFNDTQGFTDNEIETLASEYIQDAQQAIIYANIILQEVGSGSALLSEASSMLDSAKNDNNEGYPAAALFEALEALAKANLALELVDATTQEKIESKLDRANQSAHQGIGESRMMGIEPILAVSYYEFAESLVEENVQNSLFYYKYSDLLTGVLTMSEGCSTNEGSRYVGIPERASGSFQFSMFSFQNYFIIFGLIGLVSGILIGVLLSIIIMDRRKSSYQKRRSVYSQRQSSYTYNHSTRDDSYYRSHTLPRNINEYFNERK